MSTTTYNTSNKYVPQTSVADAGMGKLNLSTTFSYDGVGNLTQVDGPRSDVSDIVSMVFDAERRVTQKTDALGKVSYIAYDADGHPARTAMQVGSQWLVSCSTYTLSGKLLKTWGPAQTAAATTCPTAAAPTPVTDYAYDNNDRLIRVTENLTAAEGGNLISLRKRNGQSIAFAYDNLNRLTSRTYPTSADNVSFAYDLLGRRIGSAYADGSHGVGYVWDNAGRLISTTEGGVTWDKVTSQAISDGLRPDNSKPGGYSTFGTPQPAGVGDWTKYLWNRLTSDASDLGGSPMVANGSSQSTTGSIPGK